MSTSIEDRYLKHYLPLVREFVHEVESLGFDIAPQTPQPFLPLYGERYESSSLRMVIVGQDTRGYGCLNNFINQQKTNPAQALDGSPDWFRAGGFVKDGKSRHYFWGFAMMFLAALHGRSDWGVMKRGACREILSSFAWGNVNAVEYYDSSLKQMPPDHWQLIQKAAERFNGIGHLIKTLRPRVVVVLSKRMNPSSYFAGLNFSLVEDRDSVRHFRIDAENVDVFQVPHPQGMLRKKIPADRCCAALIARLLDAKIIVAFPEFVQRNSHSEDVIQFLRDSAPQRSNGFNKFCFIEWVAEELKKRESFMSVPTLCSLLNELGYRTNYGAEYQADRGSYTLISATYRRLRSAGKEDRAQMVAEAFRKANFEYAYDVS